jgi:hypothetical protein
MTIGEVKKSAVFTKGFITFHTIGVRENTPHESTKVPVVLPEWAFTLLNKYIAKFRVGSANEDLVFVSNSGERIPHFAGELEQLSSQFGKKVPKCNISSCRNLSVLDLPSCRYPVHQLCTERVRQKQR